jgi:PAS domain S-box-containing protein
VLRRKTGITRDDLVLLGPLLGAVVAVLLTIAGFVDFRATELRRFHLEFSSDATLRARLLEQRLNQQIHELLILSQAVGRKAKVEDGDLRLLAGSLGRDIGGLVALDWVPGEEPGKAGPVGRLVPREALERAWRAGEPVATGRIPLPGDAGGQHGFFLVAPVYGTGADSSPASLLTPPGEGNRTLKGFLAALYQAEKVVRSALEDTAPVGLPFDLVDESAPLDQRLIYRWDARLKGNPLWPFPVYPRAPSLKVDIPFGGRRWGVEVTAGRAYLAARFSPLHWLLLPFGLAVTGYFSLTLRRALAARMEMEKEVAERTASLTESEDRFRAIFDAADDAIFVRDPASGDIVQANRRTGEMFGYRPDELLHLRVGDLSDGEHPWTEAEVRRWIERARKEGPQAFEWKAKDREGRRFWVEVHLQRFRVGEEEYLLFTVRDVDRRRKEEEEIQHARKLESLSALAGGVGHDINNLLTALLGNLALAGMENGDAGRVRGKLEEAGNAGRQIKDLVERLMSFAHQSQMAPAPARVGDLLREAAAEALGDGPTRVEWELEPGLWAVDAEEIVLRQALVNLLENAREAMPWGVEVAISADNLTVTEENPPPPMRRGEFVRIIIRDHGVGIARKDLSRIFDLYYTTKQDPSLRGVGLSLPLTYAVIKRHGGFITVQSQVGKGSTFTICLPRSAGTPA